MFSFSEMLGAYTIGIITALITTLLLKWMLDYCEWLEKQRKREVLRIKRRRETLTSEKRLENAHRRLNYATNKKDIDSAIDEINKAENELLEASFLDNSQ